MVDGIRVLQGIGWDVRLMYDNNKTPKSVFQLNI